MKVLVEEKSPVEKKVDIQVEPERYKKVLDGILKKVGKNVQVPGFRKGKAPQNLILRRVGLNNVKNDLLEELIPKVTYEALSQEKLIPLSTPQISSYDDIEFEMGQPINFTVSFEVKPEFEMGEYKDLELTKIVLDVDEEDLFEKQMKMMREQAGTMTPIEEDRGVEEGDVAHVDFDSFHEDGTPVAGGGAKNYYMTVEKANFIPGFLEHIVGKKAGEEWEFEVDFPEEYPDENLKGGHVKFKMKLHGIMKKELPELDDEFAKSQGDYETYEELAEEIKKKIKESIDQQYRYMFQEQILRQLVERMSDLPVPKALVKGHTERFIGNLKKELERRGQTLEQHLESRKMARQDFLRETTPKAIEAARGELILDKIGELENIEVTDEEINEEVKKFADNLQQDFEIVKKAMERDNYLPVIEYNLRNNKIFDIIIDNAKILEKTKEQIEKELEEKEKRIQEEMEKAMEELEKSKEELDNMEKEEKKTSEEAGVEAPESIPEDDESEDK